MRWREPRVPAGPLLDEFCTDAAAAAAFNVSPQSIANWRASGFRLWDAERRALQIGKVPESVWPQWVNLADRVTP